MNLTDECPARCIEEGPGHQIAKEPGREQQKKTLLETL